MLKCGDKVATSDGRIGEVAAISGRDNTCLVRFTSKYGFILSVTPWISQDSVKLQSAGKDV